MRVRSFVMGWAFGLGILILGGLAAGRSAAQAPQKTQAPDTLFAGSFTYQGELTNNGVPINGSCDFQFSLFNAFSGGTQLGTTHTASEIDVQDGRFAVELDASISGPFEGAFTGADRWLGIAVRCPAGSGAFAALNPRQKITAAPYALGLKPGAVVSGATSGNVVFTAGNTGTSGSGVSGFGPTSGVYGAGTSTSGETQGVYGYTTSSSTNGRGVYGKNDGSGAGVQGLSAGYDGVLGQSTQVFGNGVHGIATNGTTAYGVWGVSINGRGVVGTSTTNSGVMGTSTDDVGVFGSSANNIGVSGSSTNQVGVQGYGFHGGVRGFSTENTGVFGQSTSGSGVIGVSGGNYASIWGFTSAANPGVLGQQVDGGTGSGVEGVAISGNGVVGVSQSGNAGQFYGNVNVTGALYASVKNFRIDHPLNPSEQYLQHAAVESAEMKTLYDGIVTLDAHGRAEVVLPAWFEALNGDFRYQLTAINSPGPGLYIAAEIKDGRFAIAGGTAGMKVSWQVSGVRRDPYALRYPLIVEQDKPEGERGTYLDAEGYGQPAAHGVDERYRQALKLRADPAKASLLPFEIPPAIDGEQRLKFERK